ncbi:MAG TPA: AAA family ATPase [bacterium]
MTAHERRLIALLSRPGAYPHPAGRVERRETHVSHVFLAGDWAYKLKKPVKFPFLDASTLARRKIFCLLELRLNRRLAPWVYWDMVPVVESPAGLRLGGRGKAVEWLVRMRRLPEDRMLDGLVARRAVGVRDMRALAGRLVPFFKRAARGGRIRRYGTPEAVGRLVLGNLEECRPFLGRLFGERDRAAIDSAYRQYLALHQPVLERRAREGWIIDGHGDLRCENICLASRVSVFDCVEFEPAFRCADVVNDFGFLLMDLEFRGRADLASALLSAYRSRMRDRDLDALLAFYKCHRSLVRGKVRGFAWMQHPRTSAGRTIRGLSRRHFALARRYAEEFAPPRLIAVGGLIGTGKSTLARGLAERLGAVWLRTDEIRLGDFAHLRRPGQGFARGLYAPAVSARVYARLIRRAEQALRAGRSVVCDGTFSKSEGRLALRGAARRHGASFLYIECAVPKALALRRLADRARAGTDISEARPEHYERLLAGYEPVRGLRAGREWIRVSGRPAPEAMVEAGMRALRRAWGVR